MSKSPTKPSRFKKLLATTAVAAFAFASFTAPAMAGDRVDELEAKLDQALKVVGELSTEVKALKTQKARRAASGDVGDRLDEVETMVYNLEDKVGSRTVVSAFDAKKLDIGGFLHTTFTRAEGEDGTEQSFNRNIFELLVKAQLTDDISAFFANAFIREGSPAFGGAGARRDPSFTIDNKSRLVIAWANYRYSDKLNVQVGRFITPHGIINIDHFPAVLLDPEQPQFLRPFGGDTIFPNFLNGAQLHGKFFVGESDIISYNTYAGNHQGDAEKLLYGARVEYAFNKYGVKVGLNTSTGARNNSQPTDEYNMYGVDFLYDKGMFQWKNEVFVTDEDSSTGDRFAFYTQPAIRINPQWTIFYRYDFLDKGIKSSESTENVVGVNFLPVPTLRLRATATNRDFEAGNGIASADAQVYQLSATLSF